MAPEENPADRPGILSIGQLAKLCGVSPRTLRYYEELGILPAPPRSAGGTRLYPKNYRFYVEGALALKELGFTLDEIVLLGQLALGRPLARRKREQAQRVVRDHLDIFEHKIHVLERLRDVLVEADGSNPGGAHPGGVRPVEALEDTLGLFRIQARAFVGHLETVGSL